MSSSPDAAVRAPGREHIPIYPRGFIALRIVQLILTILIIALSAYSIYFLPYDGNTFILAVAVMALISSVYHLVARYGAPSIYNYWAILGLDIFFVVMWLASFALQASRVGALFALMDIYSSSSYYSYNSYEISWLGVQAGAAGLGGIQ
ncbi:hypothetical protein MMYC01_202879, partial [Madurella mycetomatis]